MLVGVVSGGKGHSTSFPGWNSLDKGLRKSLASHHTQRGDHVKSLKHEKLHRHTCMTAQTDIYLLSTHHVLTTVPDARVPTANNPGRSPCLSLNPPSLLQCLPQRSLLCLSLNALTHPFADEPTPRPSAPGSDPALSPQPKACTFCEPQLPQVTGARLHAHHRQLQ